MAGYRNLNYVARAKLLAETVIKPHVAAAALALKRMGRRNWCLRHLHGWSAY